MNIQEQKWRSLHAVTVWSENQARTEIGMQVKEM